MHLSINFISKKYDTYSNVNLVFFFLNKNQTVIIKCRHRMSQKNLINTHITCVQAPFSKVFSEEKKKGKSSIKLYLFHEITML